MILNFCRHLFAPDKFFHVFIPFLKKRTVHSFFESRKKNNKKGTLFVQHCNSHSTVVFEARRTVRTYPFLFGNEDFLSGSAFRSHVSGENGHRKRIFSKTLTGVESFENAILGTRECARSHQRWYRFQSLLRFRVDGQKRIQKRKGWTRILLKRRKKIPVFKQKRTRVDWA